MRKEIFDDIKVSKSLKSIQGFGKSSDKWIEELFVLQTTLPVRALNVSGLLQSAQHILVESNIRNQSNRSRAVHIKMQAFREHLSVKQTLDRLRGYILASFSEELKQSVSKTITERKAYVDSILEKERKVETLLDSVVRLSDMVIEDCDANGYTLMRIQNTLEQKVKDR